MSDIPEQLDALYAAMADSVVKLDKQRAAELARHGVERELDLNAMIEKGFVVGVQQVGELWAQGEYFLPELVMGAEAMKAAMAVINPAILARKVSREPIGRVVIGTIEGDIHDIGKTLVATMLNTVGFEVTDLGKNVKVDRFIAMAEEKNADIIGISALLTTTMVGQKKVVEALKQRGLRERFRVIVGGAPTSKRWAQEIGADGQGANAMESVELAKRLVGAEQVHEPAS
jgi:corrinoid protein of di/trimethylamine methyltransferase